MSEKNNRDLDIIKEIAELIKKKFNPQKIILFGSYAYGRPEKRSDIDILVIMNTTLKSYKQAAQIRLFLDEALGVVIPMDILVRTPQEIERRKKLGDFFIKTVLKRGIYL